MHSFSLVNISTLKNWHSTQRLGELSSIQLRKKLILWSSKSSYQFCPKSILDEFGLHKKCFSEFSRSFEMLPYYRRFFCNREEFKVVNLSCLNNLYVALMLRMCCESKNFSVSKFHEMSWNTLEWKNILLKSLRLQKPF